MRALRDNRSGWNAIGHTRTVKNFALLVGSSSLSSSVHLTNGSSSIENSFIVEDSSSSDEDEGTFVSKGETGNIHDEVICIDC